LAVGDKDEKVITDRWKEINVIEFEDRYVNRQEYEIVKNIISSKEAILRFEGKASRKDITIGESKKNELRFVLDLYEILGGNFQFTD